MMDHHEKKQPQLCKSVFRNGREQISRLEFTRIWMQAVKQIEKGRACAPGKGGTA